MSTTSILYRKNPETGDVEKILQSPEGVASALGNASLSDDIKAMATKEYVDNAVANVSVSSIKGLVADKAALDALTGMKNGDIYFVGAEADAEWDEYIYFEEGARWELFGRINSSSVDLSNYSTIAATTAAVEAMQTTLQGNIDITKTELEGDIEALRTELEGTVAAKPKDMVVTATVPTSWPADVADTGVVLVVTTV